MSTSSVGTEELDFLLDSALSVACMGWGDEAMSLYTASWSVHTAVSLEYVSKISIDSVMTGMF